MTTRNNFNITKNFNLHEFECRCCGCVMLDSRAAEALQKVRDKCGALTVTSGYRCSAHNKAVGGATDSAHMYGRAVDIAAPASQQERIKQIALAAGFDKVLCNPEREYIHMQINK